MKYPINTELISFMGDGRSNGTVIEYYNGQYVVKWNDIGIRKHSPIDFDDIIKNAKYTVSIPITPIQLEDELFTL